MSRYCFKSKKAKKKHPKVPPGVFQRADLGKEGPSGLLGCCGKGSMDPRSLM